MGRRGRNYSFFLKKINKKKTYLGDVHYGLDDLRHVGLHGLDGPYPLEEAVVVVVSPNLPYQEQRSGELLRAI